jgi:citrate/tricarballylate utilization protein
MSAPSPTRLEELVAEAQRMLAICNACRYCEGYCAVFPALERRLAFSEADVHYLANLCHNCGACLYACQYAPPHEFALNFPRMLAKVRRETYARYAWPTFLGRAFEHSGVVTSVATMLCLAAVFAFTAAYASPERFFAAWSDAQGSFYAVLPHGVMAGAFGAVFAFVLLAFAMSFARFWPDMGEDVMDFVKAPALSGAVSDTMGLRYLDTPPARRLFHHFTFYGFLLCFAATSVATIYHYVFGWRAPYPLYSLPVLLGIAGGIGLLVGPAGLFWEGVRRDRELGDPTHTGMNVAFLVLLFLVSATGLALMALREARAMGVLLSLHLGAVLALFITLPYGKFVHALYRFAALVRFHLERKRPGPGLASE